MLQPGRKFSGGSGYRYGFNGKENDKDVAGEGNIYDYGFRIYNPRIGKFLSVDPLTRGYPMLTPYQYASNNPIQNIDIDGLEGGSSNGATTNTDLPLPSPWNLEFLKAKKDNYDNSNFNGLPGTTKQSIFAKNVVTSAYNQAISAIEDVPTNFHIIKNIFSKEGRVENSEIGLNMFMNAIRWWHSEPYKKIDTYEDIGGTILLGRVFSMGVGKFKVGGIDKPKIIPSAIEAFEADGYAIINDANGIEAGRAFLGNGGDLNLVIRTKGTGLAGRGADVFRGLHDFINANFGKVKSIRGVWRAGEKYGDNLKTFNELVNGGMSKEQAAMKTYTGKMANRLKFKNVQVKINATDAKGNATSVDAIFTK